MTMLKIHDTPPRPDRAATQAKAIERATQLAAQDRYRGPSRFDQRHYAMALQELSSEERLAERGFAPPTEEPTDRQKASAHLAESIKVFRAQGRTDAVTRALSAESPALRAARAGMRPSQDYESAAHFSRLSGSRIGNSAVRLHAAAGTGISETGETDRLKTDTHLAAKRVAADLLVSGGQPTAKHRNWVAGFLHAGNPPPAPRPGDSGRALAAYNRWLATTIDDILERARRLLRDPAERAKLLPTRLGV